MFIYFRDFFFINVAVILHCLSQFDTWDLDTIVIVLGCIFWKHMRYGTEVYDILRRKLYETLFLLASTIVYY